jgi:hypothetical protein
MRGKGEKRNCRHKHTQTQRNNNNVPTEENLQRKSVMLFPFLFAWNRRKQNVTGKMGNKTQLEGKVCKKKKTFKYRKKLGGRGGQKVAKEMRR